MENTLSEEKMAVAALVNYELTMSSVISKSLETIRKCGINNFIEDLSPFFTCFTAIDELCSSFGCQSTNELEKRLEALAMKVDSYSDEADAIEGYFSVYTEWTKFLTHCDKLLERDSSYSSIHSDRDILSYQVECLSKIPSEKNRSFRLDDILSASETTWMPSILAYGCQVVVVTRGLEEGARRWQEETACPFPIYLDPTRELYEKMKMRRSLFKVFCPDTMKYYVERKNAGGKFLSPYDDIPDDLIQMGGDIIFSKSGKIELAHLSQNAGDRPDVVKVLELIKKRSSL